MLKLISILLILSTSYLFPLEIDNKTTFNELLSHSKIYKDYNRYETISTIQNQKFKSIRKEILSCGYSPNYNVWIRFTLTNITPYTIKKVIEYNNPLTSDVEFFQENRLAKKDGLLNSSPSRNSLNPIFNVTLKPHQSKQFYVKASSKITTLIVRLNLWSTKTFEKKERNKQIILALFFGAIFIMILYNTTVSILTKEKDYIFYILFVIAVSFHHFIYTGATNLYFSSEFMDTLVNYFSFIVAIPTIFLALYIQNILSLKEKYPKHHRVLYYVLGLHIIIIFNIDFMEIYQYRSLSFIIFLFFLFYIVCYAVFQKDRQAYYIITGWILFIISGLLMYLSSSGTYDIFISYPYLVEISLILEIVAFSFALSSKINLLNKEKLVFEEKELSHREAEHRFKNTIQIILSFITFQKDKIEDKKTDEILTNLETRIVATSHLHSQLQIENTNEFLSSILNNIEDSFKQDNVQIETHCDIDMHPKYVKYCGQIIYEAVTNAFKYAFNDTSGGKIEIYLYVQEDNYHLTIKDNGRGFKDDATNSLGFDIIETLAILQLDGILNINSNNGVQIDVIWRKE